MTKKIDRMHAHSGRYFKENDKLINIANVVEKFDRTTTALNAVQTAEGYPVISLKSNYGLSDLRDRVSTVGSGAVENVVGDGRYTLSTGTTANSVATLDSVERGRYVSGSIAVPGLGVRLPDAPQDTEVIRWGYFNDTDGFGFGCDSTDLFVFRRYLGAETKVYRPDWDDPMDGTGPSGDSIITSNVDIYRMPFRWYGSGPVSFEVAGTGTRTDAIIVHIIEAPDGEPIVLDPNLPIRAEISNNGGARDISMEVYGRQFSILGRYNPNRRITSERRLSQSVGTTFVPLVSFRQKTSYDSVSVKTSGISLLVSNANIILQVRVGATLTGASFTAPSEVPASETALEFDNSATAVANGQKIYEDTAAAGAGVNTIGQDSDIPEVDLPVNEEIVLCARSVSGTATVTSVFRAREEW